MTKHTVLVVEDEPSIVNALKDKLVLENFSVLSAPDGEAGLALALQEHPDMILLDIIMPKKDGLSMLNDLRADAWGKDANVILLTNVSDNAQVSEALAQGTFEFLVKSNWTLDNVVKKIKDKLHIV